MKPILFNTEMVRAILDGRKTVTRRVIKPQPFYVNNSGRWVWEIPKNKTIPNCCTSVCTASREWWEYLLESQMPYSVGDILYVRETFIFDDYEGFIDFRADFSISEARALCWQPSIHMPKRVARIFLRVTGVRVERLQEISNKDALREGVARHGLYNEECYAGGCYNGDFESSCAECEVPREGFSKLWNSTVKDIDRYGWNANPWVFVYSFEIIEKPVGMC